MKPEAAGSNGIGPLVRQFVHERNAARKAGDAAPTTTTPSAPPSSDTVQFSAAALARFEAWKAKHTAPAPEPEVTEPVVDPAPPGTEPPTTPVEDPAPISILV